MNAKQNLAVGRAIGNIIAPWEAHPERMPDHVTCQSVADAVSKATGIEVHVNHIARALVGTEVHTRMKLNADRLNKKTHNEKVRKQRSPQHDEAVLHDPHQGLRDRVRILTQQHNRLVSVLKELLVDELGVDADWLDRLTVITVKSNDLTPK